MPHHQHPVNVKHHDEASFGERLADRIAAGIGSWRFLIIQTGAVIAWISLNTIGLIARWDVFPFVLLNLLFSVQAAYTGPVLLLAGNRQSDRDRQLAEHDFQVNQDAHALIDKLLAELARNTEATLKILGTVSVTKE